ncbi:hypothetical protein [Nostoc sp. NMS7]|nr:hypothetical protein [Nostoc sp. NMS7]
MPERKLRLKSFTPLRLANVPGLINSNSRDSISWLDGAATVT